MGNIEFYDDRWPLLLMIIDGNQTDDDVEYYHEKLAGFHARREPFLMQTYVERYSPKISHIQAMARWTKANKEMVKKNCKGSAIVIPSETFRILLSSFFLISNIPFPYIVTTDPEEAEAWIEKRAMEVGLEIPSGRKAENG